MSSQEASLSGYAGRMGSMAKSDRVGVSTYPSRSASLDAPLREIVRTDSRNLARRCAVSSASRATVPSPAAYVWEDEPTPKGAGLATAKDGRDRTAAPAPASSRPWGPREREVAAAARRSSRGSPWSRLARRGALRRGADPGTRREGASDCAMDPY